MICIVCLILILTNFTHCAKEYSFEGGGTPNIPSVTDTTSTRGSANTGGIILPTCKGCEITDTSSVKWSFKIGNSLLCGFVTNAVPSPDKTAMTFFGPSACSLDSGLIITAYFDYEVMNRDQKNLTAGFTAMEYYDNTTGLDVMKSKAPNVLSLTMNIYNRQTGIAMGTFSGWVIDKNGARVKIDDGKFKIKL